MNAYIEIKAFSQDSPSQSLWNPWNIDMMGFIGYSKSPMFVTTEKSAGFWCRLKLSEVNAPWMNPRFWNTDKSQEMIPCVILTLTSTSFAHIKTYLWNRGQTGSPFLPQTRLFSTTASHLPKLTKIISHLSNQLPVCRDPPPHSSSFQRDHT